ncbi:MAG: transcription elongation factor GreA [Chthonomonas sp.]|nr:transcription elongation factor GreA [Chthonomonas sp.]
MSKEILLTKEGFEKLKLELEELKGPVRQRIADAIREAKSHGDLKENAAYHEAKLNQSRMEGRINDLEHILERAKIVERAAGLGAIAHLGSKVTLKDLQWGDELVVNLVGSFEADPAQDMISITSPLGAGLLGKVVGDEFEVEAPAGVQKYRVAAID